VDAVAAPDSERRWWSVWRRSWPKGNSGGAGCPVAISVLGGVGEHHGGWAKLVRLVAKPNGGWW
jgi:hypothetical protein